MPSSEIYPRSLHDALPIFAAILSEEREAAQEEVGPVKTALVAETGDMAIELELARTVEQRVVVEALANIADSPDQAVVAPGHGDRKSTRLNSSHLGISYAVLRDLPSFPTRRSSDLRRYFE